MKLVRMLGVLFLCLTLVTVGFATPPQQTPMRFHSGGMGTFNKHADDLAICGPLAFVCDWFLARAMDYSAKWYGQYPPACDPANGGGACGQNGNQAGGPVGGGGGGTFYIGNVTIGGETYFFIGNLRDIPPAGGGGGNTF